MNMQYFYQIIFIISFVGIVVSSTAEAQPNVDTDSTYSASTEVEKKYDPEITIMRDEYADLYVEGSVKNYAQLFWRLGAFKMDDKVAIDNYLLIHECQIYRDFNQNDFDWIQVREAALESIKQNRENFPRRFKFFMTVDLDRYDADRGGFKIVNGTDFLNLRRVEIRGEEDSEELCGQKDAIDKYPEDIVLILSRPLTYNFVELDEHIAQAFILREKAKLESFENDIMRTRYKRQAVARLRVTFSQYQGLTKGKSGQPATILYGRLDGLDIFEDISQQFLLHSINFYKSPEERKISTPAE